ncbi:MAG: DNA adenine methylase [Sulfurospirillaceae bacterium]|nr:DNA adenine methylase [Sulfurospirillaceae bacterium]
MKKNKLVAPFLKWVGGKRQIIPEILSHLPKNISSLNYCEPFIGGGALLFHLEPKRAIINDYNEELINVYKVIKNNLEELLIDLKKHQNTSEYFYQIRGIDRQPLFDELTNVQHASRIIYLNKTCFNGLYRVNSLGEFNSPFGRYTNPNIVNEPVLRAVSKYLNSSDITILNGDYERVLDNVTADTFVYLDPPYHPISESSNFTGYVQGGWTEKHQTRLKKACDDLDKKGVKFLLSNSSAPFIKELYSEYKIHSINANRSINSDGEKRGQIEELLIKNY